jgi:hypothetical protein
VRFTGTLDGSFATGGRGASRRRRRRTSSAGDVPSSLDGKVLPSLEPDAPSTASSSSAARHGSRHTFGASGIVRFDPVPEAQGASVRTGGLVVTGGSSTETVGGLVARVLLRSHHHDTTTLPAAPLPSVAEPAAASRTWTGSIGGTLAEEAPQPLTGPA